MARSSTSRRKRAPRPAAPRTAPAVPRNSGSSLKRMLYKWLWTYKVWTWPPLGIMLIITGWALYTSGGNGAWKFVALLVLEGVLLGTYHYVVGRPNGPLGKMPKVGKTAIVILITIPIFCWYFWAIKPEWYEGWRNGTFFPLTLITIGILGFFAGMQNVKVARIASGLIGLCLLASIIVGAVHQVQKPEMVTAKGITESAASTDDNEVYLDEKPTTIIVTATKSGTKRYHFPTGMDVSYRVLRDAGRYSMTTQDSTYNFTPENSPKIAMVTMASFAALTDTPERIQIDLRRKHGR